MVKVKPDNAITIVLVEDIEEIRTSIATILSFEIDFDVIGLAASGYEGLAMVKKLRPDIVIVDINMPDVDGLTITAQIIHDLPETGIIILSAQDDPSYLRLAMVAGAKAFLIKPSSPDELYNTVRAVHGRARKIPMAPVEWTAPAPSPDGVESRAGNIITVYSPQGGAGCTTIATNLASALTRENIRVLLVDANLQFGDIGVFLNLEARSTLVDLMDHVDDVDTDHLENVVTTHDSGLQVLMGPSRPELAEKVMADPSALAKIVGKIRGNYDFIVIDTSLHLDEMALALMDIATRILLVSTPNLTSVKNIRLILDLFDQLEYAPDKTMLLLNRVSEDQNIKKLAITADKVKLFLKHPVAGTIPTDDYLMLDAIRKGVPAIALERNRSKSPVKELIDLADMIIATLMPQAGELAPARVAEKSVRRIGTRKRVKQPES